MPPLELLIQNRETKKFFVEGETWTNSPNLARAFPTATAAFAFAREAGLHNVEVVWLPSGGSQIEKIINHRGTNAPRGFESKSHRRRNCEHEIAMPE
jgi:hypothetical protein